MREAILGFLNVTLSGFDNSIIMAIHSLKCGFTTWLARFISVLGIKGIGLISLGVILMLFNKTRRLGISILVALLFGGLFTNVILKKSIMRLRPYASSDIYHNMWLTVGAYPEGEFSFPSGHTTSAMATMTAVFIICNKKWSYLAYIFTVLTGLSRIYLMAHYPTDVIAGLIVGAVAGIISCVLIKLLYKFLYKKQDNKVCNFIINADVCNLFKKLNTNK